MPTSHGSSFVPTSHGMSHLNRPAQPASRMMEQGSGMEAEMLSQHFHATSLPSNVSDLSVGSAHPLYGLYAHAHRELFNMSNRYISSTL